MNLFSRTIGVSLSIGVIIYGVSLFFGNYAFAGFIYLLAGLIALMLISRNKPINILKRYIALFPAERTKLYYALINNKDEWSNNPRFKLIAYNGYEKAKSSGQAQRYVDFFNRLYPDEPELMNGQINKSSIEDYINSLIKASNGLDPNEIDLILSKAVDLNVEPYNSKEKIIKEYHYAIFLYEITHGKMPNVQSDFLLNKNEQCVFSVTCFAFEQKQITTRVNYAGPRARIKIAKGLSYNMGSYKVSTNKETVHIPKGSGPLNLTTKRILFKSGNSSLAIPLSSIIDLETYSDGIIIKKGSGNPLIFKFFDIPTFKILFEVIREGAPILK